MRRFGIAIGVLFALGVLGSAVLHFVFAEPISSALEWGIYGVASLAAFLGFKLFRQGPVPDKRFKSGFKENESSADYADVNSWGGATLLASLFILAAGIFVVSFLLSPSEGRPTAGRLMSADETQKWISSGPEWRVSAWRASGCPKRLDENWIADPSKRADFYQVVRTDVKLGCASD